MVKLNPDELRQISEEIDGAVKGHRDVLDHNPRISRPLTKARDAARARCATVSERIGGRRPRRCSCILCLCVKTYNDQQKNKR